MPQLVGNRGMPGKIQRKANALDLQITGDIADFMFQRDKILTMRQTQTEQCGQGRHHILDFSIAAAPGHHIDAIQRVIEKMGIDLILERLEFQLFLSALIPFVLPDVFFGVGKHTVIRSGKKGDFVLTSDMYVGIQVSPTGTHHRMPQFPKRSGKAARNKYRQRNTCYQRTCQAISEHVENGLGRRIYLIPAEPGRQGPSVSHTCTDEELLLVFRQLVSQYQSAVLQAITYIGIQKSVAYVCKATHIDHQIQRANRVRQIMRGIVNGAIHHKGVSGSRGEPDCVPIRSKGVFKRVINEGLDLSGYKVAVQLSVTVCHVDPLNAAVIFRVAHHQQPKLIGQAGNILQMSQKKGLYCRIRHDVDGIILKLFPLVVQFPAKQINVFL